MRLENRLIELSVRFPGRVGAEFAEILPQGLNWEYVIKRSQREGLTCLLYRHIRDFGLLPGLPQETVKKLENFYYCTAAKNTLILQESERILSHFRQNSVSAIGLKGIYLAAAVYPDLALRPIADMDILVQKDDLGRVDRLLTDLGYIRPPYYDYFFTMTGPSSINSMVYIHRQNTQFFVHLHWHLINSTWPAGFLTAKIDMKDFFPRAAYLENSQAMVIGPENQLLFLYLHAFRHGFDRLILVADIAALISRNRDDLDWIKLKALAENWDVSEILDFCLAMTDVFLPNDLPGAILTGSKKFKVSRPADKVSADSRSRCYWLCWAMAKGWRAKLRFLFQTIIPPPYVIAQSMHIPVNSVSFKDYLARFFRRIIRH